MIPDADVAGRARAWCLANRCLVNLQNALDRLPAVQRVTPVPGAAFGTLAFARASSGNHCRLQVVVQHTADQSTFAGATDATDHYQFAEWNINIDISQVVELRTADIDLFGLELIALFSVAQLFQWVTHRVGEEATGQ